MDSKQRLKQYIDFKGLDYYPFEMKSGLSNGALKKGSGVSSTSLEKIHNAFPELNMDWVITGRGEMMYESSNQNTNDMKKNTPVKKLEIKSFTKKIMDKLYKDGYVTNKYDSPELHNEMFRYSLCDDFYNNITGENESNYTTMISSELANKFCVYLLKRGIGNEKYFNGLFKEELGKNILKKAS